MDNIMAVFQGGKDSEQIIPMTKGDRGRYSVLIPQGDYSAVSFYPGRWAVSGKQGDSLRIFLSALWDGNGNAGLYSGELLCGII